MGSERAIEDGSGAPKSLFAKASVGTEDDMQWEVSNRGAIITIIIMKTTALQTKNKTLLERKINRK